MAVNLSPVGGVAGQFFDNNGNPLVGGKLYTYAAGTTTPLVTYTSSSGGTANTNPIILNAGGRVPAEIWLTDGSVYKFVLYDANDVLIGSWDNIVGINSNFVNFTTSEEVQIATAGQTVFTLTTMSYQPGTNNLVVYVDGVNQVEGGSYSFVETDSATVTFTSGLHVGAVVKFVSAESLTTIGSNASLVVYEPAGAGAVITNVQAKLRETVSVKDFGAVGDGVTDDTAAFQAADANADPYYVPSGTYLITSNLTQQAYSYGDATITGGGLVPVKDLTADARFANINRRKLIKQLPIRNTVLENLCTTYSYPNMFPQALAVDSVADELFITFGAPTGGLNQWAWIQVYDLTTGAIKTTFTTAETWRENLTIRYVGGTRYLYTLGASTAFRIDITTLPVNLSTPSKADTYAITLPQSLMAFDGDTFTVQRNFNYRGSNRAMYDLYNTFFVKTGEIVFPLDVVGTIGSYIDYFPKAQGVCSYNGTYIFGIGSGYIPGSPTPTVGNPYRNGALQGIVVVNGDGSVQATGYCNPQEMINIFATKLGYVPTFLENEGIYNDNGKIYTLWATRSYGDANATVNGITLTQEFSDDIEAMDFTPATKVNKLAYNIEFYNSNIFFNSFAQLTNPVTGEALDSFAKIFDFMNKANLSQYRFSGTGQTMVDFNSAPVTVTGSLCEFYLMNTTSGFVSITGTTTTDTYWVSGLTTMPVQTKRLVAIGGGASSALDGVILGANAAGKIATGRTSTASVTHYELWNGNGLAGYIRTVDSRTQYHVNDSSTYITGGAGSPEGVISAAVGSLYLRTDGGAGTSLYVKESGTGNTGWAAK